MSQHGVIYLSQLASLLRQRRDGFCDYANEVMAGMYIGDAAEQMRWLEAGIAATTREATDAGFGAVAADLARSIEAS